jgi:hypothetical protein
MTGCPAVTGNASAREVIGAAELVTLDGEWAFQDGPLGRPPELTDQVLAVTRDENAWSWLTPFTAVTAVAGERFAVLLPLPEGLDNRGFVGWLATALKQGLGTGIFVVGGQNSGRGGSMPTGAARPSCAMKLHA